MRRNVSPMARPQQSTRPLELLGKLFEEDPALAASWLETLGLADATWSPEARSLSIDLTSEAGRVVVTCEPGPLDVERADAAVLLAVDAEPWPERLVELAGWQEVRLVSARWCDVGRFAESHGGRGGKAFAERLVEQGLLPTVAVSPAEWKDVDAAAPKLRVLIREVLAEIGELAPVSYVQGDQGSLYGLVATGRAQLGVGFARDSTALGAHLGFAPSYVAVEPLVYSLVHSPGKPGTLVARMALAEAGGIGAAWGTHPLVARPVHHVVYAEDFNGQVRQLVGFVREIAERYRRQGYLRGL